jgi:hypothetical protein
MCGDPGFIIFDVNFARDRYYMDINTGEDCFNDNSRPWALNGR